MSWLIMLLSAPVRLFMAWRDPPVTWEQIDHMRCDEIQVKRMLQSTRATADACIDAYSYSMLQEQVSDLDERHKFITIEIRRLLNLAAHQGLITDRITMV